MGINFGDTTLGEIGKKENTEQLSTIHRRGINSAVHNQNSASNYWSRVCYLYLNCDQNHFIFMKDNI